MNPHETLLTKVRTAQPPSIVAWPLCCICSQWQPITIRGGGLQSALSMGFLVDHVHRFSVVHFILSVANMQAQEISLNYHFCCEQYTHFASGAFFNFNGTAGVWRKSCIDGIGGWNARTTVEDMDLSLRAFLAGWKAVFLKDVPCLNEVRQCLPRICLPDKIHARRLCEPRSKHT